MRSHKTHADLADSISNAHRTVGQNKLADKYAKVAAHHLEQSNKHKKSTSMLSKIGLNAKKHPILYGIGAAGLIAGGRALKRNREDGQEGNYQ